MKSFFEIIICLSIILPVNSCKQNKQIEFTAFPESYKLKGIKVENELLFKTGIIDVCDSFLILNSAAEMEKCIYVFNKNTFKYVLSTGNVGRGPHEIANMGLGVADKSKGIIWYRDLGKMVIWEFNIQKALLNPVYFPETFVPLPEDKFFIQFFSEPNNLFSFADPDQEILISFFNHKGEVIDSLAIPDYLNIYKKINENTRKHTSTYLYLRHPQKEQYVIAYRMADVVAIIDSRGNIISKVRGPGKILEIPKYDENYFQTNKYLAVSDQYIYSLYLGKKQFEMKNKEMNINYPQKLHVFNWKGQPVAKIDLEYPATTFDVDIEKNRIITFSPVTGGFIYYNLPEFR
ncbi:MAG: hypothetical protein GX102_00975 [Porphyromonadaceae bacterium]|nr:hypothetical protein [Porphyromonadaceae bacterium]